MKNLLFILLINIVFIGIYFGVFYGLYTPTIDRYIPLTCVPINETFSKSVINCQKIVFNKALEGECFYDKNDNDVVVVPIDWINMVIIVGTITSICMLFFICILSIQIYKNTVLKIKTL